MTFRDRLLMIASFAAIHIVWGTTYLAIRYAVETIPPLLTAGLRHTVGGAALFAVCWWRGLRPTRVQWRVAVVTGILFFLIGHGSLHWAEQYVPSGTAALFVATEPVWVALLGARRLSAPAIAGLVIGIGGVALLVGLPHGATFTGSIVIVIGAFSWSVGIFYSRSAASHPDALMSAAMSLLSGGALLILAAAVTGGTNLSHVSTRSALGLAYLIVFGSLTFAGYTWLLARVSPVLVSTHAYTNPLIAVLIGALVAGEALSPRIVIAGAAILAAIALVRGGERDSSWEAAATPATPQPRNPVT